MTQFAAQPELQHTAVVYARLSTKEQAERDGDPEGYSIPAQRDACSRKAASLGATVTEVFIDRGESARSADRPELQRMLAYLAEEPTTFVIVHKVDRLARNRSDDVTITATIAASGAKLVSVTENIDETPSGLLLHGIMSSIAEFYSRNLAAEVVKGTQQKVRAGGTPTRAPIGYRNVRKLIDGYETRTVEVDPERAELVSWAFVAYASGNWSLRSLADELEARGLTNRPGPRTPARPVPANKLHQILRNRYYLGYVTWRGVEYDGKHPPLVDAETFELVQRVLNDHRVAGERAYRREHYLVGSLRCGRCHERLLYTVVKNRTKQDYGYFYCASRTDSLGCGQRYLPEALVEAAVTAQWRQETVPEEDLTLLREELARDFASLEREAAAERARLERRLHAIKRERFKWAEKAMAGAVPDDIAADKQRQLAAQLLSVEGELNRTAKLGDGQQAALGTVLSLIADAGNTYARVDNGVRRSLNQAWFEHLYLDEDREAVRVVGTGRSELSAALRQEAEGRERQGQQAQRPQSLNSEGVEPVGCSNFELLVELRGFEPLTPSMRTRCATGLRYSPEVEGDTTSRRPPAGRPARGRRPATHPPGRARGPSERRRRPGRAGPARTGRAAAARAPGSRCLPRSPAAGARRAPGTARRTGPRAAPGRARARGAPVRARPGRPARPGTARPRRRRTGPGTARRRAGRTGRRAARRTGPRRPAPAPPAPAARPRRASAPGPAATARPAAGRRAGAGAPRGRR